MTTLTEARRAALKLSESLPEGSTYAAQLATLSDYLDNQVPLNIENSNLLQRLAVAEGFVAEVHKQSGRMVATMSAASSESCVKALGYCRCPACVKVDPTYSFNASIREALRADTNDRRFMVVKNDSDCTAYLAGGLDPCDCTACRVRANA